MQAIERGAPADGVLRPGDRIIAVEGRPATVARRARAINAHRCAGTPTDGCRAATPVHLTVRRAGRDLALTVYPRYEQGSESGC